ncbi:MAG: BolA family transcriptional regulator [Candidatus Omnitrophica bacterium]|nr:BolA family transcriptional regulator [Candidatus Omnitrophota bacterium]
MEKEIQRRLQAALNIHHLELINDSHKHRSHHEALKHRGGHYFLLIVSNDFNDLNSLKRHRKIHEILNDLLKSEIHALGIKAYTVEEYRKAQSV